MASQAFPVVKGRAMRVTRVGHCGLPVAGENSSLVTKGFVTYQLTKVTKAAEDLEQTNAEGEICVADRTPPELKWWEVSMTLCGVDPDILGMLTDDPVVLDYADRPVGFRSSKKVRVDSGAAIEVWTGIGGADCVEPVDDTIFETAATTGGVSYGYFLAPWVKEAVIGDIEIGASVMDFTISGITGSPAAWGRGPYEVVPVDEAQTPGRLLKPMTADNHIHVQRTTIAPPEPTNGPVELELPDPYFTDADNGGESGES